LLVFPKHQLLGENHMVITVEKALLNNQSTLENFALVEELNAQSAEIISGGWGNGGWGNGGWGNRGWGNRGWGNRGNGCWGNGGHADNGGWGWDIF
jgi:hypothetical protein